MDARYIIMTSYGSLINQSDVLSPARTLSSSSSSSSLSPLSSLHEPSFHNHPLLGSSSSSSSVRSNDVVSQDDEDIDGVVGGVRGIDKGQVNQVGGKGDGQEGVLPGMSAEQQNTGNGQSLPSRNDQLLYDMVRHHHQQLQHSNLRTGGGGTFSSQSRDSLTDSSPVTSSSSSIPQPLSSSSSSSSSNSALSPIDDADIQWAQYYRAMGRTVAECCPSEGEWIYPKGNVLDEWILIRINSCESCDTNWRNNESLHSSTSLICTCPSLLLKTQVESLEMVEYSSCSVQMPPKNSIKSPVWREFAESDVSSSIKSGDLAVSNVTPTPMPLWGSLTPRRWVDDLISTF